MQTSFVGQGNPEMKKLDRAITLMTEAGILEKQVSKAAELRERLSENELVVSVVGQFKRGKSSLINAILGKEILPVGIVPLTAVVTEIRSNNYFSAIVRFENDCEKEIEIEELSDYISEQKNKDNYKRVNIVTLWTENAPFGSNVTLVDTPGVGSTHQHNTEASYTYIEKSDAVLFLLSVDSPVSEIERDFLLHTHEFASKFYFVVNKVDTVGEQSRDEFISYSTAILSETIGCPVMLYPVSATTGEGVEALKQKIGSDIYIYHNDLLTKSVTFKLNGIIRHAKSKISLYLRAAAIPSDELKEKLSILREKQLALSMLTDEVQALTRQQADSLVERIGTQMNELIAGFLPEMEADARYHYEELKDIPSRIFERKLTSALENGLRNRLSALNEKGLALLSTGYASIVGLLNDKAEETANFISDMMRNFFGVGYAVEVRRFTVSERNDFYISFKHNWSLFIDEGNLVHLLPRRKANAKIFDRGIIRMRDDIERNKANMLYNYRYKMQESLRSFCQQFSDDISAMTTELNTLLDHAEQSHQRNNRTFQQTKRKLTEIIEQLEEILK
jgi:small GTP-binding protein